MTNVKTRFLILNNLLKQIEDGQPSEAVQQWHSIMSNARRCEDQCPDDLTPEFVKCANCLNAKLLHTCETERRDEAKIADDCFLGSARLMRWLNHATA